LIVMHSRHLSSDARKLRSANHAICSIRRNPRGPKLIETKPRRLADRTDMSILRALVANASATHAALAESTGLARNTVRARLARYAEEKVMRGVVRQIDPAFLGFPLRAYVVTTVTQRKLDEVGDALKGISEVLEVLGLTGSTDLVIHVVARDAEDLYRVAGRILEVDGVTRTETSLIMRELVEYRIEQLIGQGRLPA
jgi:DNA-binding Lrp family transcriptional regulator